MKRQLLVYLVTLGYAAASFACSCVDSAVSLEQRICSANASDGLVLEVVLIDQPDTDSSVVRIDRQLVGTTESRELTLVNGSGSFCSFSIDGAAIGSRYLLFASREQVSTGRFLLFTCGNSSSLYAMNRPGTEIAYGVAPQEGRFAPQLRFEPFDRFNLGSSCPIDVGELASYSRFANLQLFANPGDGRIRFNVTTGTFPPLQQLRAYTVLGQDLGTLALSDYRAGAELDLSNLPGGLVLLEVTDGVFRRTFRYLRMR
ncbi:MAG: hypothetical protein WA952_14085 [Lewinella sp.]